MTQFLSRDMAPMEARAVDEIPRGEDWFYEPKWDGFRCLAFRDADKIDLQSKSGQPLARYFPELVEALLQLKPSRFVLDGEIVIPEPDGGISFDKLLQRIHPAVSRIKRLAVETPASFVVFDLLFEEPGPALTDQTLFARRRQLENFATRHLKKNPRILLSPMTANFETAQTWFRKAGAATDGLMAKNSTASYASGTRDAMVKIKPLRTADCVIGGFRYASKKKIVGSLLLGLYDDEGLLHHVGYCSGLTTALKEELTPQLEARIQHPGFTGSTPGGPSRWSTDRSTQWEPLRPELVVEVGWDHYTNGRFRHGTKLIRWRPDKSPKQCKMDQVNLPGAGNFTLIHGG